MTPLNEIVATRSAAAQATLPVKGSIRSIGVTELSWTEIEEHVPAWRALAERALEPNVFYSPDFALAAAPVFGKDVRVLAVWRGSNCRDMVGFFPLRRSRWRFGFPLELHTGWTHPYAPLGVPLVDTECAAAVLDAILRRMRGSTLLLPLIPETGPFAHALDAALVRHHADVARFDAHARALLEPKNHRARYLDSAVSAGKRKELRRQRRRLEELGRVSVSSAKDVTSVSEALDSFLALEATGWKGRAGTAAAMDEAATAFMRRAVTSLATKSQANVDGLLLDDRTLAAAITLRSGPTAWFWKIAYDEDFARFSPGTQLACDLTARLLADPAIALADSCATADHPMIDHLWRERLPLSDRLIAVGGTGIPFRALKIIESARRQATAIARRIRDRLRDI